MKQRIKQAVWIIAVSVLLALGINALSEKGIPLEGHWPSINNSYEVAIPPSADEGDPPFVSLDEAAAKYQSRKAIFIDSRDPEDFEHSRIKGAINLPYDYLEDYWDEVIPTIPKDREVIIYCSGTECELSLFLARDMVYHGYENVYIFYGGWREWERARLPMEGSDID